MEFVVRDPEDTAASRSWSPSSWLIYIFFLWLLHRYGQVKAFPPSILRFLILCIFRMGGAGVQLRLRLHSTFFLFDVDESVCADASAG